MREYNDETRPMLMVPFWDVVGGATYLVASDGVRLHAAFEPSGSPGGYAAVYVVDVQITDGRSDEVRNA